MPGSNPESRIWPWLLLFLSLAFAVSAASHSKDDRSSDECAAEKVRRLSIAEASRSRAALEQACIEVTGIIHGGTLYQDVDDIYRDTEIWRDHDPKLRKVARIGLRRFPENLKLVSSGTGLRRVTLIGKLHDCARDWGTRDSDDGDIIVKMGTGWCHHNSGAVLKPTAIVAQGFVTATRKTGRQEWRRFGDIALSKKDAALAVQALAHLDRLLDAARRRDSRALLNLHGYSLVALAPGGSKVAADHLENNAGTQAQHVLDLWFSTPGLVLSHLPPTTDDANVRLYKPRWNSDRWPRLWACWGMGALAENDLPISSRDALNVVGRPYACVHLERERHSLGPSAGTKDVWVATTSRGAAMQEPVN